MAYRIPLILSEVEERMMARQDMLYASAATIIS
jgi:hypothetical protein